MQGFNMGRYHAPDSLDSSLASPSELVSRTKYHPLGSRAKNIQQGVLVVRFEMPFAIWCSTCPSSSTSAIIGQGVRFNAQKKHAGKYFSSSIWSFRMKHTACGGWIELRTDPKNSDFVVTEGAKRRDYGVPEIGPSTVLTEAQKQRQDAFSTLEDKRDEKVQLKQEALRLEELRSSRERDWKNSDERNQAIRKQFRIGRKVRQLDEAKKSNLQDTMGLSMDLDDVNDVDIRRARLVDFGSGRDDYDGQDVSSRSAFTAFPSEETSRGIISTHSTLQRDLASNARSKIDPFGIASLSSDHSAQMSSLLGIKRKRNESFKASETVEQPSSNGSGYQVGAAGSRNRLTPITSTGLVDYDSD